MTTGTGQGIVRTKSDEPEKPESSFDDDEDPERYNIPNRYDVIYATFDNAHLANNATPRVHRDCGPHEISCLNTDECISIDRWCDSRIDCGDSSDETACTCKARLDVSRICDG